MRRHWKCEVATEPGHLAPSAVTPASSKSAVSPLVAAATRAARRNMTRLSLDHTKRQGWVARGVTPSGSRRTRRDSLPSPGSHHLDHQGILHPGPVREAAWVALLQPLPRRTGPAISPSTSALSYSSSPRTRRGLTRRNSHRWPSPFARLPLQELHRYYGPVRRRTDHARCAFPSSMREPQTRLMPPQCRTPLGQ